MGDFEGPVEPYLGIGGFLPESGIDDKKHYNDAEALVITFVVNNHLEKGEAFQKAVAWERQ